MIRSSVGAIATASGGVDFSSSPKAAAAYFDCVNANGGINGRPIDYAYEDDAFDPTQTAQIAAGFAADEYDRRPRRRRDLHRLRRRER